MRSGGRPGGLARLQQQPAVAERNWCVHVCNFGKTPKTTEKMLSVWFDIGATGAKLNSFRANAFGYELTPIWPRRQLRGQFPVQMFVLDKLWIPQAWKSPKDYLALRGTGLWGLCALGAIVIDRALSKGAFEPQEMLRILNSGKKWDWTNKGHFQGLGDWSGAVKISEMISEAFSDESGVSVKDLYKKIMG